PLCPIIKIVAVNQDFISSAEIDIAACPITYYGLKYNKVYVSINIKTSHFYGDRVTVVYLSGAVYKTNRSVWNADICSTVTCDEFGVATPESTCGPMERCQGNNTCTLDATCTVTASTIIDVIGQLHTVPDRCGYKLMEHVSIPDLEVFGVFQERRRKDVSFLERLVLHLKSSNVDISLEQGGRVKVNDTVLPFNTSEKVVHGVKVSKGPNGLTAEVTASDYAASIHFNGHTAQILFFPPMSLIFSCETTYTEDADVSINCNDTAEWCNILREQPFSTCNLVVDPQPFISACSSVLCKYPAVDGFNCQFFEAYTRACSMHNVSVEGWKSQIKCAETQAKCQNMYCSEHEFCGEKNNGWEWACLCRAIFASKYRPTNTFGEPTVCEEHTAALTLAGCLLEERGIDYSVLHMNNESCVGQMDNETHMVTFSFDQTNTCGTVVKSNGSKIIYHNTIQTWNSSNFGIISRHDDVHLDFSCHYLQPGVKSLAVRIKDSSVIQELTSGQWRYNLSMIVYTDEARRHALTPDTEVNLDQTIYIELQVDGIDENLLSLVVDSCWATTESSPNSSLKYSIVGTGCPNPVDKSVRVINNGQGLSSYFSFSLFQFTGRTGKIYLHCKTMLCVNQGTSCAPKCNQSSRRRRSAMSNYMDQNPGLITMAWRH
uniref:ZP domain-containing protein n=1 Tax=Periophthalmus magnuspinnatus TaxID=409849 RepID=A0A3B4BAY2_9GOBI